MHWESRGFRKRKSDSGGNPKRSGWLPLREAHARTVWGVSPDGRAAKYGYDPAGRLQNWTDTLATTGPDVTMTIGYNAANQINT